MVIETIGSLQIPLSLLHDVRDIPILFIYVLGKMSTPCPLGEEGCSNLSKPVHKGDWGKKNWSKCVHIVCEQPLWLSCLACIYPIKYLYQISIPIFENWIWKQSKSICLSSFRYLFKVNVMNILKAGQKNLNILADHMMIVGWSLIDDNKTSFCSFLNES